MTLLADEPLAPAGLEHASPGEILAWAAEEFGADLVVTASFGDAVLAHLVAEHAPSTEIVLIDTQYLFAETRWFADRLAERYRLRLRVVGPERSVAPDDRWQHDIDGCCEVRKVAPLRKALDGRRAWISGLRRADGPSRADTPVVEWNDTHGVVKISPLAALTDDDIERYQLDHDLPRHPLSDKGYPSIGCWPCTRPVGPGEDPRAGRWAGTDKTECGLHLPTDPSPTVTPVTLRGGASRHDGLRGSVSAASVPAIEVVGERSASGASRHDGLRGRGTP